MKMPTGILYNQRDKLDANITVCSPPKSDEMGQHQLPVMSIQHQLCELQPWGQAEPKMKTEVENKSIIFLEPFPLLIKSCKNLIL